MTAAQIQGAALRRPLIPLVAGIVLYSTGPVLVQASALGGPGFAFWRLWRLWLGVAVLGGVALLSALAGRRWPRRREWRWAAWGGACFAAHQLLFFTAIKLTSVTDATLMSVLSPIVVAVLAVPLFGERPSAAFRLWSLVAMAGAALVTLSASAGPEGNRWPWHWRWATCSVEQKAPQLLRCQLAIPYARSGR